MALREVLKRIQGDLVDQMPNEFIEAFGENLNRLIDQNIAQSALTIGDQAPNFTVMDTDGKEIQLYDLLKKAPVIINFFRGNWCPFCMAELANYQESIKEFSLPVEQFLFISPQMARYSAKLKAEQNFDLTLIADQHNQIAHQFGLVFSLSENIREIYRQIGADLSVINGDDSFELPIPATYVVAPSGKITYAFVETNYMIRAEPREVFGKI